MKLKMFYALTYRTCHYSLNEENYAPKTPNNQFLQRHLEQRAP